MRGANRYHRDWRSHRADPLEDLYDSDYPPRGSYRSEYISDYDLSDYDEDFSTYAERGRPAYRHSPRSHGPGQRRSGERYRGLDTARDAETLWAAPANRRQRAHRGPWRGDWRPDEWWHAIGPEPRPDYDWVYRARPPERYGWTGETGRG